ncbi:MAG TPA: CcmD family protein [Terriglobia bacterium]|nr:CcmD family protein [Terriglobia bacterium]
MVNKYLFLAYAFTWLIFILYAWNLSRRQARLRKELEEVKRRISEPSSATTSMESKP